MANRNLARACLVVAAACSGCFFYGDDCRTEEDYWSFDLALWCSDSGECSRDDKPCKDCVYDRIGEGSTSWEYPISKIGSGSEGLTVLELSISLNSPGTFGVRVLANGAEVCSRQVERWGTMACPIPADAQTVRIELVGEHSSGSLRAKLREPLPTRAVKVCYE